MLTICLVIFFALLIIGCPIVICMGFSSTIWLLFSENIPALVMSQKMFTATDSFALMAVPFFMLAGQIMDRTEITSDIVEFADSVVGHIRGGLAHTCELAGILLAGISGSSNADASALGSLMVRALKKGGYEEGMACSIVASASSLGPIIPPSIVMILYGNAAGLNIGKLFMGGLVPGVIMGIGYMVICYFYAKKHNIPVKKFQGFKHMGLSFIKAIWALLMPIIIIGGILCGVVTTTEAGVLAVVYGICYGFIRKKLNIKTLIDSLRAAVISSASPIAIISISSIFSYVMAREGVTANIANFCQTNISSGFVLLLFIVAVCVFAGCFVDGTAVMLLLTPIFLPIAQAMGINVQQFSIIFMIAIMSGGLTPPVGSILFIVTAVDNTPLSKMVKPIFPFICVVILVMLLLMLVPGLATWLPSLFGY
ncbi:MAG: TRAP transporter large permease [Oscillospiraceae bacterium]